MVLNCLFQVIVVFNLSLLSVAGDCVVKFLFNVFLGDSGVRFVLIVCFR